MEHLSRHELIALMRALALPVVVHDHREVVVVANAEFADLLGYRLDATIGMPVSLLTCEDPDSDAAIPFRTPSGAVSQSYSVTERMVRSDGVIVHVLVRRVRIEIDGVPSVVAVVCDRADTAFAAVVADLRWQASHDQLTGLNNRRGVISDLARTGLMPGELLMVDIDHLKVMNDSFGHEVGDDALRRCGRWLGMLAVLNGGIAGRWAGDEFVVIVPASNGAALRSGFDDGHARAGSMTVGGRDIDITVSVGWAHLDGLGEFDRAFMAADDEMYRHKARTHSRRLPSGRSTTRDQRPINPEASRRPR